MSQTTITKQFLTSEIIESFSTKPDLQNIDFENLTDSELYQKCREYGLNAKKWLRKVAGLLPEVSKRQLYKKRGCASIHQFAAKLAGMNYELTDRIIRIDKNLKDKPRLQKLLKNGEVGWSKLELIAYISTPETDEKWAEKVTNMPYDALKVFVQEYRDRKAQNELPTTTIIAEINNTNHETHNTQVTILQSIDNAKHKIDNTTNSLLKIAGPGNFTLQNEDNVKWAKLSLHLHPDIEFKLRMRKQQIEKHKGETLSWNEVFYEITKNWDMTSPILKKIPKAKKIDWGSY